MSDPPEEGRPTASNDPQTSPTAGPRAATSGAPPTAGRPTEPAPLTVRHLGILVGIVALTVIALILYSQERSLTELTTEVGALRSEQERLAAQLSNRAIGSDIDVSGAPALGPVDDVVTLVEFSDYECPFCIRYFTQTLPELRAAYVDTGKIRYVFKDFPIDENHPMAIRAHEAAHCAMEQQKFWPLHLRLFSAPGTHTPDQLVARATEAGLDIPAFKACVASGRTTAAIRESVAVATGLGADGTPSFYLGRRDLVSNRVHVVKMIDGAQPYSTFQEAIDGLLK